MMTNGCITSNILGSPEVRRPQNSCITLAQLRSLEQGGHKCLSNPCCIRSPQNGDKIATQRLPYWGPQSGEVTKWVHKPCHMGCPLSREVTKFLHGPYCIGCPQNGEVTNSYITRVFSAWSLNVTWGVPFRGLSWFIANCAVNCELGIAKKSWLNHGHTALCKQHYKQHPLRWFCTTWW